MSMSPAQIIEAICPELSGSPSLQVYLGMAVDMTSRDFYGAVYNYAVAYMAAHLFALTDNTSSASAASDIQQIGGGAPISSMSEGGISVSFAQTGGSDSELGSTKYGKLLLGLKKGRPKMGINQRGVFL